MQKATEVPRKVTGSLLSVRCHQEAVKTFGMELTLLEAEMLVKGLTGSETGGKFRDQDHQVNRGGGDKLNFEMFQAAVKRIGAEYQPESN